MADSYLERNEAAWATFSDEFAVDAERLWPAEPNWGLFGIPESEVGMFPANVRGLDVIELGCGTGYVSAWLARLGANPVGIDLSEAQLDTARRMQEKHGIHFPLHVGNAEETPFADQSADLVISEYGASIWCDPFKWIPEAWRLLRPGGYLRFLRSHPLIHVCSSDDPDGVVQTELIRDYFDLYKLDWGKDGVEFTLSHARMVTLLVETGFAIDGLVEIRVPADAATRFPYVSAEWASRWPCEEVWKARKR